MDTDVKPQETAASAPATPAAPADQADAQAAPSAAPATPTAPTAKDRWILPLCLTSLVLWGLFVFACLFAIPEYRTLYDRLKSDPPFITRVVMGLRDPAAMAIVAGVSLVFTAAAHLSKNRSAAVAMVLIALLVLGGSFAALHIPYAQVREELVR